jgi:hypothetical protein
LKETTMRVHFYAAGHSPARGTYFAPLLAATARTVAEAIAKRQAFEAQRPHPIRATHYALPGGTYIPLEEELAA